MTDDKTKIASDHDEHFVALPSGFDLGKYELQAVLGQGGFGITYKAWDSSLKRAVAIKEYLPSDVAVRVDGTTVRARSRNDQESFQWGLERFLDEARALAQFEDTRAIVRVYDYMQANGTAYMVMALIDGTPLSAVYRREAPLSEERLKGIVLPVLDGLDDVHAAGFLHRDIKPANILMRGTGAPVLIDFGAARNALGEKSRSITSVFTPGYAPFEQYTSSGKQGPWTDIYALAATLYHGITGKVPPQATDRIREDPMVPAVRAGAGRYSPQFLAAVDRGLEVFENRRPQTVAEWRDMLTGATPLAVPGADQPPLAATGYGDGQRTVVSQPGGASTAVPTLNEHGLPSQVPASQGPASHGPASQAPISQGPISQAPASQGFASPPPPRRSRLGLIAAVVGALAIGGGAAATFLLSRGPEVAGNADRADESIQERAQRLADEARRAADQARQAQVAAEQEMKRRAEEEAQQKAADEARRQAAAEQTRKAAQALQDAEKDRLANDDETRRRAEEETRKIADAEAQRLAAAQKAEQELLALQTARLKAETELAEARRVAEEAKQQAEEMRLQAEKARQLAAEEQRQRVEDARRRAENEAKLKAEAEAKRKADEELRKKAEAEAKAKAEADARAKAEAAAKKKAEDEARRKVEADARARAEAEAKRKADDQARQQRAEARAVPPAVVAPPPPVTSADVRSSAAASPAPATQQAAASAAPGFVYAGVWHWVVDCPNVRQPPFIDTRLSVSGPNFVSQFYRDGRATGTISGAEMRLQIEFTGRGGNSFKGTMSLSARSANEFRGSGIVSGFGDQGAGERSCPVTMIRR